MSKRKPIYMAYTSYEYEGIGEVSIHASLEGAIDHFGDDPEGSKWNISVNPIPGGTVASYYGGFGVSYEVDLLEVKP